MKKKKQPSKRKERVVRYSDMDAASRKIEFIEIPMDMESLEKAAHLHASWQQLVKDDPANDFNEVEARMLQEERIKKIFQTASQVLTEIQFKIFVMRYAYDLKQKDIAKQLKCNQSYVPSVLKASVKKIQSRLKNEGIL
jgi:RNA polymerase sigma factor (sigma-70 family)